MSPVEKNIDFLKSYLVTAVMDNSSQNKCPKPFEQRSRPPSPPHLGNARIDPASFSVGLPWLSFVIKMKNLSNTALLLKCVQTILSTITKYCKENCSLLYNSYYKNSINPIFLGRERIWSQWFWKAIFSKYFDNIQPMNYCFFTPDPPALFCLDGGKRSWHFWNTWSN